MRIREYENTRIRATAKLTYNYIPAPLKNAPRFARRSLANSRLEADSDDFQVLSDPVNFPGQFRIRGDYVEAVAQVRGGVGWSGEGTKTIDCLPFFEFSLDVHMTLIWTVPD